MLFENELVSPADSVGRQYVGLERIGQGTLTLLGIGKSEEVTSTKRVFSKGDILFGKLRPYFRKVILTDFDVICSTDIFVIKPKEGVYNKWLFYLLASDEIVNPVSKATE